MKTSKVLKNNRNVKVIIGSIIDNKDLPHLVKKADVVFHLAAAVGVKNIVEYPLKSILTNVKGTGRVLDLSAEYRKKVLVASTSEVYGKKQ